MQSRYLIEACAAGCPVLLGEHTYNFQQAALDAIQAGAAKRIQGELLLTESITLMESLKELLMNTAELAKMRAAAKSYATEHQGATNRILAALDQQNLRWTKKTELNLRPIVGVILPGIIRLFIAFY